MGHREICFRKNKIITFCTHYHLHYLDQLAETKVSIKAQKKYLLIHPAPPGNKSPGEMATPCKQGLNHGE
jgi:hypothetical protein